MNGVVSVTSNATGMMSPSSEQRAAVATGLATNAAVQTGARLAAATQAEEQASASASQAASGSSGSSGSISSGLQSELGKDSFLQLLVLQMQNQDPLNPTDNTEMIAQLAQFTSLEAMNNLNDSFEVISGNVDQLNFISGSQLLGKTVGGVDVNGEIRQGVVEGVHLDGSLVMLTVDGSLMSMAGITRILDAPEAAAGGDGA